MHIFYLLTYLQLVIILKSILAVEILNSQQSSPIHEAREQKILDSKNFQTQISTEINVEKEIDEIKFFKAFYTVIKCFIPSFLSLYIEFGVYFSNVLFSGFIGDASFISGWGLGLMANNLIVFSFGVGLCGAIDTLVSQAFGRKDFIMCGVLLNSSRIIITILFVPQMIVLLFSEQIFIAMGLPEESSKIAFIYIWATLIGSYSSMMFECTRRYLLAVGIYAPIMYILVATLFTHILTLYLLTFVWELGILGIGIATTVTYSIDFLAITIYSFISKDDIVKIARKCITRESFKMIPKFLKFGVPACLMLLIDWFAFEILSIYSGWLGVDELAASVIMNNFLFILLESAVGISYTSASLIGNPLGSKKPKIAKKYAWATIAWTTTWASLMVIIYSIFHNKILQIYSSEENVINIANSAFIVFIFEIFWDIMQTAIGGVMRAIGYQNWATFWNVIAWWCLMLPLSYLWAFTFSLGFEGVWIGLPIGNVILMIAYLVIIIFAPWKRLSGLNKVQQEIIETVEFPKYVSHYYFSFNIFYLTMFRIMKLMKKSIQVKSMMIFCKINLK